MDPQEPTDDDILAEFAAHSIEELRVLLGNAEKYRSDILVEFPELENVRYQEPDTEEEFELITCERLIRLLRLAFVRNASESSASEAARHKESDGADNTQRLSTAAAIRRLAVKRSALKFSSKKGRKLDQLTCGELDELGIPVPEPWRSDFGVTTWSSALKHSKTQRLVQSMFSKDRKHAG